MCEHLSNFAPKAPQATIACGYHRLQHCSHRRGRRKSGRPRPHGTSRRGRHGSGQLRQDHRDAARELRAVHARGALSRHRPTGLRQGARLPQRAGAPLRQGRIRCAARRQGAQPGLCDGGPRHHGANRRPGQPLHPGQRGRRWGVRRGVRGKRRPLGSGRGGRREHHRGAHRLRAHPEHLPHHLLLPRQAHPQPLRRHGAAQPGAHPQDSRRHTAHHPRKAHQLPVRPGHAPRRRAGRLPHPLQPPAARRLPL